MHMGSLVSMREAYELLAGVICDVHFGKTVPTCNPCFRVSKGSSKLSFFPWCVSLKRFDEIEKVWSQIHELMKRVGNGCQPYF